MNFLYDIDISETSKLKSHVHTYLLTTLVSVYLIPNFFFVNFSLSSFAFGLVFVSLLNILFFSFKIYDTKFRAKNIYVGITFIFIIFIYSIYGFLSADDSKPIQSLVILPVLMLSVTFAYYLKIASFKQIVKTTNSFILLLLLLGWIQLYYHPECCNYTQLEKPVFPFSEHSHYALCVGFFIVSIVSVSSTRWSLFLIFNLLALALLYPNLTLLVFALLAIFVLCMRFSAILYYSILITIPLMFFVLISLLINKYDYFSDRLDFSDINNLTTLVWIQGWELAYLNFMNTHGLGLGFQALGMSTTVLPHTSDIIYGISGKYNNLYDGGFLASKVISEFGLIGLFISFYYIFSLFKFVLYDYLKLKKLYKIAPKKLDDYLNKTILFKTMLLAFSVEYFLRGYGYFSPGLLFVIGIILVLSNTKLPFVNKPRYGRYNFK